MSEEDRSENVDNGFDDQDNFQGQDGENLFKDIVVDAGQNKQPKRKKLKKMKKQKKSKKEKKEKKKKRRHEQEEEDDYGYEDEEDQQINSMFEDEAESDDNSQQESVDRSAQIGEEQENQRFDDLMNKPRTMGNYIKKFDGKNDRDINALYSRGVNMLRQSQAMYPADSDPKIYIINVKPRHEDEIVIFLLNKARHLAETSDKVAVVTATSMKKKYSGKIFVQAFSEKDVRDALEHLPNVSLTKNLQQLDRQGYTQIFNQKYEQKVDFKEQNFVQIKKGLYEDDLAQIIKIRANSADVIVVPRLQINQIAMKIREHTSKITNETDRKKKMAELLTLFLDHKAKNYKQRPPKKNLSEQELRQQLGDNPAVKKIRLSANPPGLIILNYKFDEIAKHSGTYNPIQFLPFAAEGNFIAKMNEQKGHLTTATNYKKGEEVEIISGGMIGHFGVIYEIKDNIAIITCKNKELFNQRLEEPVQNIIKKFKEGQRVKVISGADAGKTGTVLKIQQKVVELWTDNQNSIRVNKKNLEVSTAQIICAQNVHNLKKDDLIKTTKNQIGIVLETTKDNIKILDTNNTIQIIGNLDFDSKINTRNIIAKNRSGDQIGAGCLIIVRKGAHEGKKCKVIHVYRQNVFLFNAAFNRTAGISVQNAENCSLMSKNQAPQQSRSFSAKNNQSSIGGADNNRDQISVGKTIILRTGPLKGYQGLVKSINKDKIQVRVLSKACTQWVPRENVTTKQQTMQVGKTPNRRGGNTHTYVPSPSHY